MSYQLEFCLGGRNSGLEPGDYIATPEGIKKVE